MVGSQNPMFTAQHRKTSPAFRRARRAISAVLSLIVTGGCAQIAGIETWKPLDCDAPENEKLTECQGPAATVLGCSQCLEAQEGKCTTAKDACNAEMAACPPLLTCRQGCTNPDSLLTCIGDCCIADPNPLFDNYVECLCNGCIDACDGVMPVCTDMCGVGAPM